MFVRIAASPFAHPLDYIKDERFQEAEALYQKSIAYVSQTVFAQTQH